MLKDLICKMDDRQLQGLDNAFCDLREKYYEFESLVHNDSVIDADILMLAICHFTSYLDDRIYYLKRGVR